MRTYMIVAAVLATVVGAVQLVCSWSSSSFLLFWPTMPALPWAFCTLRQLLRGKGHRLVRWFPLAMLPLWLVPFAAIAGSVALMLHGMEGMSEDSMQDVWRSTMVAMAVLLPFWVAVHWPFMFARVQRFSTASSPILWRRALPAVSAMLALYLGLACLAPMGNSRVRLAHLAAAYGWAGTMKALLSCGMPVNVRDRDGNTPLHLAAMATRRGVTGLLLQHGADVEATNRLGQTPLLFALGDFYTAYYHRSTLEPWDRWDSMDEVPYAMLLIGSGASVTTVDRRGNTALTLSFRLIDEHPDFIDELIRRGADVNRIGLVYRATLLENYLDRNRLDKVRELMARGARLRPQSMVYCVSREGVLLLLDHGIDINAAGPDGVTLLFDQVRSYRNDASFIRFLLEHGARVDDRRDRQGKTMLEYAYATGNQTLIGILENAKKKG